MSEVLLALIVGGLIMAIGIFTGIAIALRQDTLRHRTAEPDRWEHKRIDRWE